MELAIILIKELVVVFMFIATGLFARKINLINDSTATQICNMLFVIITPSLIVKSFQQQLRPELMHGFWSVIVIAFITHAIAIVIVTIVFKQKGADVLYRIRRISVVLSNCGFMAFPLLDAVMGQEGILYGVAFLGVFAIANWTWALATISGEKKISLKKAFLNPGFMAFAIGLAFFLLEIKLPTAFVNYAGGLSALNTPLSMIAIGAFLLSVNIRDIFTDTDVYKVVIIKNIVVPVIILLLFFTVGFGSWFESSKNVAIACVIMASCSSAASTIMLSSRVGADNSYGAKLVAASTACSIITLPLIAFVAEKIL